MGVCPPELGAADRPGTLESAVPASDPHAQDTMSAPASSSGFRRRLERFRGAVSDPDGFSNSDGEAELKLQLVLLREENTRLKAARHQPAGPGSAIDRVRSLTDTARAGDALDDTFSLIGECLAVREGLDQVCLEIGTALDAVRGRLQEIAEQAEATLEQAQDGARLTA
jgi:hypothetical protein